MNSHGVSLRATEFPAFEFRDGESLADVAERMADQLQQDPESNLRYAPAAWRYAITSGVRAYMLGEDKEQGHSRHAAGAGHEWERAWKLGYARASSAFVGFDTPALLNVVRPEGAGFVLVNARGLG